MKLKTKVMQNVMSHQDQLRTGRQPKVYDQDCIFCLETTALNISGAIFILGAL